MTPFGERLAARVRRLGPTCVGLDPFLDRVPGVVPGQPREETADRVRAFCQGVVEVAAPLVAAVKPQVAFFEALGAPGWKALEDVVRAAKAQDLVVVLDAKRGDIGSTAEAYAKALLDDDGPLGADAVTLSPYLGPESLAPFALRTAAGKGLFVLVRTSNPGAGPWQTDVAERVAAWVHAHAPGPGTGDVGAVVAATLPGDEVARWRAAMPHAWFLVPGFGAQGAGVEAIRPHFRPDGTGALVTSSREVLYPRAGTDGEGFREGVRDRARAFAGALRFAADPGKG